MDRIDESVFAAFNLLTETVESLLEYKINGAHKKRINVRGQDGKKAGRKKMTYGKHGKGFQKR